MTEHIRRQLEELYDRHGAALVLYARQFCSAPDDALQEAMLDLTRLDDWPIDVAGWLFKVVRRKALNIARSDQRRAKHHRQAIEHQATWFAPKSDGDFDSRELARALAEIQDEQREIVVARMWGELSFEQIAELVGRPISTVHRHYKQALIHLQERLEEQSIAANSNTRAQS